MIEIPKLIIQRQQTQLNTKAHKKDNGTQPHKMMKLPHFLSTFTSHQCMYNRLILQATTTTHIMPNHVL